MPSLTKDRPLELLVVEDNPGDVLLLKEYLNLAQVPVHNVLQAGSMNEVLDVVGNKEIDLAFLDLSLPDSEGIYSFIMLNSRLPHTPIIVLTGLSDINVALEALSLGAQDYVMKSDFNEKLLSKSIQYSIERKRMMEKLRESNERYEIVARATNDVIWDWDLESGKVLRNKEGVKSVYGVENPDDVDTINKWLMRVHPDDQQKVKAILESPNMPGNGNSFSIEYRFRRPDGVYAYVYDRGYALRNEAGRVIRMIGATQDISQRKRVEQKMEKEKGLSDSIINSLPGIFYFYDADGALLRWNKNFETVSGYNADELKQMRPEQFFATEYRDAVRKMIEKAFSDGYANGEGNFLTKDGNKIAYYFTGLAIDFEGKRCVIGTGIDISVRKKSEKELQQLAEQLRNLTAYLQNVREEEQRRIAREIHDELGQQITGLKMDLAWLQKKITANSDPIALREKLSKMSGLLDDTVQTIRKIASELRPSILDDLGLRTALEWQSEEFGKRFDVDVKFSSDIAEMNVDPATATGLFRIYQESLTNVARHSQADMVIASLELEEDQLILSIADNGKGFIINPNAPKSTLGLLNMKERALMMGGTLDMQSELGKGTTILVRVPLHGKI